VHLSRWVSTHGYALNVDLDPSPFTDWITPAGLDDAAFTSMAPSSVGRSPSTRCGPSRGRVRRDVRRRLRGATGDEPGLWPQPLHAQLAR
jgi:lipoate-protein ligase B